MDQCMIDVTNVHNISTGDEVIIFGEDIVTADDLAKSLGTINYEIMCVCFQGVFPEFIFITERWWLQLTI